jgi:Fe-S oxidoreductase
VVIPLPRMGDYCDGIERINIEQSIRNKIRLAEALTNFIAGDLPLHKGDANPADDQFVGDLRQRALDLVADVQGRWQWLLDNLDTPLQESHIILNKLGIIISPDIDNSSHPLLFHSLQNYSLRVSWKRELRDPLRNIFDGAIFRQVIERIEEIHAEVLRGRLFVALHMHAGDGNVHTNIPVNSDNYEMLLEAGVVVSRIMGLVRSLDGVISGEHGIGITKLEFLTEEEIALFRDYKQRIDPKGSFNKGKLMAGADLRNAYTPSFSLLGSESLIMDKSEIGRIADSFKNCLRCGKCKPVCSTHVPRANLFYSPRNKILGTSLLIEAFLYEEQTRRGISRRHITAFSDIAEHCSVCHKCLNPCPVDIDYGLVSIAKRNFLRKQGKSVANPGKDLAMVFLNTTNPKTIKLMRKLMISWGFRAQRLAVRTGRALGLTQELVRRPPSTVGTPSITKRVLHSINKPLPGTLASRTSRALLGIEDETVIPVIWDPHKVTEESEAVFYFPGCGSERLFSQVALATQAMLFHMGVRTVLPPGYLCCGFPQTSAGRHDLGQRITTDNRVLFHRMATTLNYLDIRTVIVSCGTCMDQFQQYEFDMIFPGCRLLDIHEYLMEKGITVPVADSARYLYHDPCHTPMKTHAPLKVANQLMGQRVELSDRCCGESGTLAVTRPDVSTQVRFRKEEELIKNVGSMRGDGFLGQVKVLTSCPSCLQGLARFEPDAGIQADYIVVELARRLLGENWLTDYVTSSTCCGIERVLL